MNQAKESEGYKKALPNPEQPVIPEAEILPQSGSKEFRTEDTRELELGPLFRKPKSVRRHQEILYDQERVLQLVTQLSNSENPKNVYDQARMELRVVNNTIIIVNIKNKCPPDENLIDIDGLAAYFIRARLARQPETVNEIREQFEFFVKEHHYPLSWVHLIKAPSGVKVNTEGGKTQEDTQMADAPAKWREGAQGKQGDESEDESEDSSDDEEKDEDFTDPGFKPGYTALGEMIVAHRKVGRDGRQLLVATGHKDCPFYQLRPAGDYLREVVDAYYKCEHAKQLTNTPLQGQYKGIRHVAEEYSRPGALKKPVTLSMVEFHDKPNPEWAYRTVLGKFQKSQRGVDEAIELCKKREARIRVKFYAKHGVDLPKPNYRQALDERRQTKERQDSNMFDPNSFSSFVSWWEKKNDTELAKHNDKMSEMMVKWDAMRIAMS